MTSLRTRALRELALFALLAAIPALAIAGLYHLHPWPTPMVQQAANFRWDLTGIYLLMGVVGVMLSPWTVAPETPRLDEGRRWGALILWAVGAGVIVPRQ